MTWLRSAPSRPVSPRRRPGSLGLADLEGGTFSVSTLGMYGVDGFTPVINPPNTAILGVGRLRDDLVLRPRRDGRHDHPADAEPHLGPPGIRWRTGRRLLQDIVDLLGDAALGARPDRSRHPGVTVINYQDLFHVGLRVPDLEAGMAELGRAWACMGHATREPHPDAVVPRARAPGDPSEVHLLGRGTAAHRAAGRAPRHVLGRPRLHGRAPRRRVGRRRRRPKPIPDLLRLDATRRPVRPRRR